MGKKKVWAHCSASTLTVVFSVVHDTETLQSKIGDREDYKRLCLCLWMVIKVEACCVFSWMFICIRMFNMCVCLCVRERGEPSLFFNVCVCGVCVYMCDCVWKRWLWVVCIYVWLRVKEMTVSCVCVCEREKEGTLSSVHVFVCVCVCVWVYSCMCVILMGVLKWIGDKLGMAVTCTCLTGDINSCCMTCVPGKPSLRHREQADRGQWTKSLWIPVWVLHPCSLQTSSGEPGRSWWVVDSEPASCFVFLCISSLVFRILVYCPLFLNGTVDCDI